MNPRTTRKSVLLLSAAVSIACALGAARCARADDSPSTGPLSKMTRLEWVYQGAALADMLTTLDIKNHPNLQESNPLMGAHPSDGRVLGYFALYDAGHYIVTRELLNWGAPRAVVNGWEIFTISYEAHLAVHNYRFGLRFTF